MRRPSPKATEHKTRAGPVPGMATGGSGAQATRRVALPAGRKAELTAKAARLFGAKGYDNTSMRDIAAEFGILHGSLYHHFESKEALFVTVYQAGIDRLIEEVQRAIALQSDPWDRLEAACVAHLEALLAKDYPAAPVLANWSTNHSDTMRAALVQQRDRYERLFSELAGAVTPPAGVKQRYFRLGLLGALNGALGWYQQERDSPQAVARQVFALFRPALR